MKELDLLTFPQLADRVVRPTLRSYVRMVWPMAIPMVAMSVFMLGMQAAWLKAIETGQLEKGQFDAGLGADIFAFLGAIFLSTIWSTLCIWAVSIAAVDLVDGRPASFWRSLRRVFEPKIFGTLLLEVLVHLVGMLCCGIGLLVTLPLLFLLVPLMIDQQVYGVDALKRSAEMVRFNATGRWADSGVAQALGLFFIGWGISTAIAMVVQVPFMLFQQYYIWNERLSGRQVDIVEVTQELSFIQVPVQVVNVFAQLLCWFYWAIAAVVLYREIRRRREGRDLEMAIPRILMREDG
jgi:uncharacterized membrane protein